VGDVVSSIGMMDSTGMLQCMNEKASLSLCRHQNFSLQPVMYDVLDWASALLVHEVKSWPLSEDRELSSIC
jgi:hypothetical protein